MIAKNAWRGFLFSISNQLVRLDAAMVQGHCCMRRACCGRAQTSGCALGIRTRFDSRTATPTLRRCRLRLGAARQHDQRGCELARPAAWSFPLAISADGVGAVPRDARCFASANSFRLSRLRLPRSGIRQGANAADGVGLCFSPHRGCGTFAGVASGCAGKSEQVSQRIAEVLWAGIDLRGCD